MNTLAQAHYAAAITGAPPGYVGSREGITLLDSERIQGSFSRPGIVLFDEIEKADRQVIRTLLNVFDHGQLMLASGAKAIDFRNTIVFMTSNLAAREIGGYEDGPQRGWSYLLPNSEKRRRCRIQERMDAALRRTFDPEFINRIDSITLFERIDADKLDVLIELELAKLNARLARSGLTISLDQSARSWLKQRGFDRRFGARSLARSFRREVTVPLAADLVRSGQVQDATCEGHLIGYRTVDGIRFHPVV
jgi:ATP-dependent Clp protease ATP-binding subunit ClpA